jgi:hypothetical protein
VRAAAVIGSANTTYSAWGKACKRDGSLSVRNWEASVLFPTVLRVTLPRGVADQVLRGTDDELRQLEKGFAEMRGARALRAAIDGFQRIDGPPPGFEFAFCCPPAPYERACLVASYFRAAKPRSKVLVLDANPLGELGGAAIAGLVECLPSLTQLRLCRCELGIDAIIALCASLARTASLRLLDLSEPLRDPSYYFTNVYWKDTSLPSLIPGGHECLRHPKLCRPWISISWISYLDGTVILLGTGFLGWRASRRDVRAVVLARRPIKPGSREALVAATAVLILAVIVNSAVTGILSGPFARYHARMVWILPAAAAVMAWRIGPGFDVRVVWAYLNARLRRRPARQARG